MDRVALCSDRNNNLSVKLMVRHTRRPEVSVHDFIIFFFFVKNVYFVVSFFGCVNDMHIPIRLVTNLVVDMVKNLFVGNKCYY